MDFYVQDTVKGKAFSTTSNFVAIASTNEIPFLLMENPTNSVGSALLSNFVISSDATTDIKSIIRIYVTPTITITGTLATSLNMKIGSSAVTESKVYTSPTVTSKGTLKAIRSLSLIRPFDSIKQLIMLPPNSAILITVQNLAATSTNISIDVNWIEVL